MNDLEKMLDKAMQQPTVGHVLLAIRKAGYDVVKQEPEAFEEPVETRSIGRLPQNYRKEIP